MPAAVSRLPRAAGNRAITALIEAGHASVAVQRAPPTSKAGEPGGAAGTDKSYAGWADAYADFVAGRGKPIVPGRSMPYLLTEKSLVRLSLADLRLLKAMMGIAIAPVQLEHEAAERSAQDAGDHMKPFWLEAADHAYDTVGRMIDGYATVEQLEARFWPWVETAKEETAGNYSASVLINVLPELKQMVSSKLGLGSEPDRSVLTQLRCGYWAKTALDGLPANPEDMTFDAAAARMTNVPDVLAAVMTDPEKTVGSFVATLSSHTELALQAVKELGITAANANGTSLRKLYDLRITIQEEPHSVYTAIPEQVGSSWSPFGEATKTEEEVLQQQRFAFDEQMKRMMAEDRTYPTRSQRVEARFGEVWLEVVLLKKFEGDEWGVGLVDTPGSDVYYRVSERDLRGNQAWSVGDEVVVLWTDGRRYPCRVLEEADTSVRVHWYGYDHGPTWVSRGRLRPPGM